MARLSHDQTTQGLSIDVSLGSSTNLLSICPPTAGAPQESSKEGPGVNKEDPASSPTHGHCPSVYTLA